MELRSGRSLLSSQQLCSPGGGTDRISALSDDMLFLILARLGCAGAAARTTVLSRRWRGLPAIHWASLREIVFRDIALSSLEEALGRVCQPPPPVSLLEIRVPGRSVFDQGKVNSLLRAAALLDPEELVFTLPFGSGLPGRCFDVHLPCFHRATSILLDSVSLLKLYTNDVKFPLLETLSLSGCLVRLDILLRSCCPRLRVLRMNSNHFDDDTVWTVRSISLQELVVKAKRLCANSVRIVAPALKQLTLSTSSSGVAHVSIYAPKMDKVSWQWCYISNQIGFELWCLSNLRLQTAERQGQLPSLQIHAHTMLSIFYCGPANFKYEVEKHMIIAFSVLELYLTTKGHDYGALVFHLLGINRISSVMQKLNISLQRSTVEELCPSKCPSNRRPQTISLPALEEVEINGFEGENHEFDLLKLILKCAPMLKRMVVKLSQEASESNDRCTKICNIVRAYPSVECYVYLSSGLMHGSQDFPST